MQRRSRQPGAGGGTGRRWPSRWSRLVLGAILVTVLVVALVLVLGSAPGGPRGANTGTPGLTAATASLAAPSSVSTAATDSSLAPAGSPGSAPSTSATAGASSPGASTAAPAAPAAPAADGARSLAQLLASLDVRAERRTGYLRTLFPLWIDADGDGCNTRHEVLIDEAIVAATVGPGCDLTGGGWRSPYDGIETTDAGDFDIDHVVPLAEAWDSGASTWNTARRTRYANDLEVPWALVAVSATSNRAKGDQDPADWMPPLASVRCDYVAMWIAVKVRWDLAVDATERSSLAGLIDGCPQRLSVPVAP